ncbi:hypothetical protein [Nocardioides alcanivorans]|uniref:hypothetical protein n=1 Tax=Nocardioides alcanivorans TaxID=2897352 RepID=UPI001F3C678D|nr:hypothetical protein [Nocardioides alcanivorans]
MKPWSGRAVQQARWFIELHHLPGPCGKCKKPIDPATDRWVVGHIKSRTAYPHLTWDPKNWQPEHRACSDRSAQQAVQEKAARNALRAHGIDPDDAPLFPEDPTAGEPRPFPSLSPRALTAQPNSNCSPASSSRRDATAHGSRISTMPNPPRSAASR